MLIHQLTSQIFRYIVSISKPNMVTILHITLEGTATDTKGLKDKTMGMIDAMDEKNKKIADGTINGPRPAIGTVPVILFLDYRSLIALTT
jgi:hypothetical protein